MFQWRPAHGANPDLGGEIDENQNGETACLRLSSAARRQRELKRNRAALEQQITALRAEHEAGAEELRQIDEQVGTQTRLLTIERTELGRLRQADASVASGARVRAGSGKGNR